MVGRHRGAGLGGGYDEGDTESACRDGWLGVNEGVIILAATNRPDILIQRCYVRGALTGGLWLVFLILKAAKRY